MRAAKRRRLPPASELLGCAAAAATATAAAQSIAAIPRPTPPSPALPPLSPLPTPFSACTIARLAQQWTALRSSSSSSALFERRERAAERRRALQRLRRLCEEGVGVSTEVFGSFTTDLIVPSSDVDVNLNAAGASDTLPLLRALGKLVCQPPHNAQKWRLRQNARIPVAKFIFDGISFDVTAECASGERSSEMQHNRDVSDYLNRMMKRFAYLRPAAKFVKVWAARQRLCGAHKGLLPSLALVVMLCSCCSDAVEAEHMQDEACTQLLCRFFRLFAECSSPSLVVARDSPSRRFLRQHNVNDAEHILHLSKERWPDRFGNGFGQNLFVLDPISAEINLGRFVLDRNLPVITAAFRNALRILADDCNESPFAEMLRQAP